MNFSSVTIAVTIAFLLSALNFVNAEDSQFYILRSKINGYCASHETDIKVTFDASCDLTNLEIKFLWQDQMVTDTVKGVSGSGKVGTGLILTYDGRKYIVPKKGNMQLKKVGPPKMAVFKKSSWTHNGSQFYNSNKDYTFSFKKPNKTEGVPMEKVILNVNGEYENSLFKKIYVMGNTDPPNPKTPLEEFYAKEVFQSKKATCETYRMSEYSRNYQSVGHFTCPWCYRQWGLHALQWKGYLHNTETGGSYNAVQAQSLNPPNWQVTCAGKNELNTLESPASYIYKDAAGHYVDPNGGWNCVTEPDSAVGAVTAALNLYHWRTPTYLNSWDTMINRFGQPIFCETAVIEEVTLCTNTANKPHEDCGWDNVDWTTGLGTINACAGMVALDYLMVGCFGDTQSYGHYPHRPVPAANWVNHYGHPSHWNIPTDLVFDPPVGISSDSLEKLQKMAKVTTESMILVRKGKEIEIIQATDPDHVAAKDCEWTEFNNSRLYEAASSSGIRGGMGEICFISDEREKDASTCNFLVKSWDTNEKKWIPSGKSKSDDKFNGRDDCSEEEQSIRNPEDALKYLLSYVRSGLCGCQS